MSGSARKATASSSKVQVLQFKEPCKWQPSNSSSTTTSSTLAAPSRPGAPASGRASTAYFDMESAKREVLALGVTGLTKKDRKRIEEERLESLGVGRQTRKTPFKILSGMAEKRRRRTEASMAESRAASMVVASKTKKRTRDYNPLETATHRRERTGEDSKRRRDGREAPDRVGAGSLKGGVLFLKDRL